MRENQTFFKQSQQDFFEILEEFNDKFSVNSSVLLCFSLGQIKQTGHYVKNICDLIINSKNINKVSINLADTLQWSHFAYILFLYCISTKRKKGNIINELKGENETESQILNELLAHVYGKENPLFTNNIIEFINFIAIKLFYDFFYEKNDSELYSLIESKNTDFFIDIFKDPYRSITIELRKEWIHQNEKFIKKLYKNRKLDNLELDSWDSQKEKLMNLNLGKEAVSSYLEKNKFKKNIAGLIRRFQGMYKKCKLDISDEDRFQDLNSFFLREFILDECIYVESIKLDGKFDYLVYPGSISSVFHFLLHRKGVIRSLKYIDSSQYTREIENLPMKPFFYDKSEKPTNSIPLIKNQSLGIVDDEQEIKEISRECSMN